MPLHTPTFKISHSCVVWPQLATAASCEGIPFAKPTGSSPAAPRQLPERRSLQLGQPGPGGFSVTAESREWVAMTVMSGTSMSECSLSWSGLLRHPSSRDFSYQFAQSNVTKCSTKAQEATVNPVDATDISPTTSRRLRPPILPSPSLPAPFAREFHCDGRGYGFSPRSGDR